MWFNKCTRNFSIEDIIIYRRAYAMAQGPSFVVRRPSSAHQLFTF